MGYDVIGLTDGELAQRVQRKDADAFLELMRRYLGLIRTKAAPFHVSALDTDDLCQEGLMGLLSAALTYREEKTASFRTYAGICITNGILTACRAAASKKNLPLNDFVSLSGENPQTPLFSGQGENPEARLIAREDLQMAKACIERELSPKERQVLRFYLGGCTYQETAERLGIPQKAVDNAIQRIRRKLKKSFPPAKTNMPR